MHILLHCSELPPVSAEDFRNRVLQERSGSAKALEESQMSLYCNPCRKQFQNQKAHDNHLNSKKHKENLVRYQKEHGLKELKQEDVTTKRKIEQRPHPALAAAAAGKGKFAMEQAKMDIDAADDDSDEYEDIEEEEVYIFSFFFQIFFYMLFYAGGF